MSAGNTTENELALYIYENTAPAWAANGNFYVALHTADPGEAGSQTTNEATYGSYARQAIARSSSGFDTSGSSSANAALIQFPTCTSGSNTITHFSIGTLSSGAGQIIASGALSSSLAVSTNIQPQFQAGALVASVD